MNEIIEPDDIEVSTVGDLIRHTEPYIDWSDVARNSLLHCLEPVLQMKLDTLDREISVCLQMFEESIANPDTDGPNADFLAKVFKRFSSYRHFWMPLWETEVVWHTVAENFLREVGPEWNRILKKWSQDSQIDYPVVLKDLERAYREIGGNLEWQLRIPPSPPQNKPAKPGSSNEAATLDEVIDLDDFKEPNCELPELLKANFRSAAKTQDWSHCLEIVDEARALLRASSLHEHGDGWTVFRADVLEWFNLIDEQIAGHLENQKAVLLWLKLGVRCFSASYANNPAQLHKHAVDRLVKEAQKRIGMLRKDIREKGSATDFAFYNEVVEVLRGHCDWWQCVKPLLLAFREFKEPAVAPDLRFRSERNQPFQPPELASQLARWIANFLANPALKRQREEDPTLQEFREEFASFCMSRLKTKDESDASQRTVKLTNDSFLEPNPIWRSCYARATLELRINPRGTSHRLALWSSQNDPDSEVRASSEKLYESLRHQISIDTRLSPRRPLMAAYWWIRQAHLRTLGISIDKKGAQRTRSKDLRWTERIARVNTTRST